MTSLTKTAIITRKIIRYGFWGIVILIVGRMTLSTSIRAYRYFFPEPPPPPTVSFGKLPALPFEERQYPENFEFILETPEGGLPVLPTQAKVYLMYKLSPNLMSLDVAKEKVSKLGFSSSGAQESETVYNFAHARSPSNLRLNIVSGVFSISYDLAKDPSAIERRPLSPEASAGTIKNYLSSAGLLPEDLSGPATWNFLKIEDGKIVDALSLSDSDLVKLNFFRKSFDEFPSVTKNPTEANVWFMVTGAREKERQIMAAQFHHFPVDEEKFATYPLKVSELAWNELVEKKAFLASLGTNKERVVIRRVYLGYYDPGVPAEFLQPVVVFEGDGGFVAYVPAVSQEFYGE